MSSQSRKPTDRNLCSCDHSEAMGDCCCGGHNPEKVAFFSRREFLGGASIASLGAVALSGLTWKTLSAAQQDTVPKAPPRRPLVVKPVLVYGVYKRREKTSWRPWGGIQTEADAREEVARISKELKQLDKEADFPVQMLPVSSVKSRQEMAALKDLDKADCVILYAAGGPSSAFDEVLKRKKDTIFFVRHRSGPVYLWYEIVSPRYLRQHSDEQKLKDLLPEDVVVDDQNDILWRLRALCGLKNARGARIVCLGGPMGWACPEAPKHAVEHFGFELLTVDYKQLGRLIHEIDTDPAAVALAKQRANKYLADKNVSLEADKNQVVRGFLLDQIIRGLMIKHDATVFTIGHCMGTVMQVADTTACLALSTLNDDGFWSFCESDFVAIPAGVLLCNITGQPSFLNDPTYPHHGVITLAHCTGPRRMDGKTRLPVRLVTHFESDFGVAPKVEFTEGTVVTNVLTDFQAKKWLGVTGTIQDVPFLPICRSQIDVKLDCDCQQLAERMRGFHWMTAYGKWLKEMRYAVRRTGIEFEQLS